MQRLCSACQQEGDELALQPQLTIGQVGDPYEVEADAIADKVMSMPAPQPAQIQRQGNAQDPEPSEEEPAIQAQSLYTSIYQRVQRQAQGASRVGSGLESRLSHSKQGGAPLPDHVQAFMGPRLGVDLSPIRVHTDSSAVQMNRDLGAQAFAHGNHVYYGAGKGPANDHLTAHELTHTVQQGAVVRATPQSSPIQKQSSAQDLFLQAQEDPSLVDSIWERIKDGAQKLEDYRQAILLSRQYIPEAIGRHIEETLQEVLVGLAIGPVAAAGFLAITTAIGAGIGSLGGGVGAAPGAAVGFEVGLILLKWMGIGFLIAWIGSRVGEIGQAFGQFLGTVWDANGDQKIIDQAAKEYAEAIALFLAFVLEGLVAYAAAHGIQKTVPMVGNSWFGKQIGATRLASWLQQRLANMPAREQQILRQGRRALGRGRQEQSHTNNF